MAQNFDTKINHYHQINIKLPAQKYQSKINFLHNLIYICKDYYI